MPYVTRDCPTKRLVLDMIRDLERAGESPSEIRVPRPYIDFAQEWLGLSLAAFMGLRIVPADDGNFEIR